MADSSRATHWRRGGRRSEGGNKIKKKKRKSHVRHPPPLPSQATSLVLYLLLSRFVLPGCALPCPCAALVRRTGMLPSRAAGWVGRLGHLPQLNIASLAGHTAHFRAPAAAAPLPGGYRSASSITLQGAEAGIGRKGITGLKLPWEGQEQGLTPGDSAGFF